MFRFRQRPLASLLAVAVLCSSLICATGKSAPAASTPAEPAGASEETHDRVVDLVTESAEHYEAGRFQAAVDLLKRAFALETAPTIQYNLARAYEGLGDDQRAIEAYRLYLQLAPEAQDRGAVARRISVLERQVEEREALRRRASRADSAPPAVPDPAVDSGPGWIPWGFAAVGVLLVGVGVGFGLRSQALHDDAQAADYAADAADGNRSAKTYATLANVAFVAGGMLAVGGVTWGVLALPSEAAKSRSERGAFRALAGVGVRLQGTF
ncbi:MAG: tetratricopeptide repeat protein [Polyangiaceae bacterium]